MERDDQAQREDEEIKLQRCLTLYGLARASKWFTPADLEDLKYFLGLNDYFKEKASLTKNVVVAGALTRIEIWDRERYHQHLNFITAQNADIENSLNELNI